MNHPSQIHLQAEQAREAGKLDTAIHLYKQAINQYSDIDSCQKIHAYCGMVNTLLHSAEQSPSPDTAEDYRIDALRAVTSATELECSDPATKATRYTAEGKIAEAQDLLDVAAECYGLACEAVSELAHTSQLTQGVYLANKIHQLSCLHRLGSQDSSQEMLTVVKEIEDLKLPKHEFEKKVWLSGALLHTAAAFKERDTNQSDQLFQEAKHIIESDTRLVLRQKQLTTLLKSS